MRDAEGSASRLIARYIRPLAAALATLALSAAAAAFATLFVSEPLAWLDFQVRAAGPTTVQVFIDRGGGLSEADSTRVNVGGGSWEDVRVPLGGVELPFGRPIRVRLDPSMSSLPTAVRALRVTGVLGVPVARWTVPTLRPLGGVQQVVVSGDEATVVPTPGTSDPAVEVMGEPLAASGNAPLVLVVLIALVLSAALAALAAAVNGPARGAWAWVRTRRRGAVLAAALVGTFVCCAPVIVGGRTFLTLNVALGLVYDPPASLPGSVPEPSEDTHGADTGAMLWQHFLYTVLAERALGDGELPLWNRVNASGRSLIGQGQAMVGDPLNWLVALLGTNAGSYDVKFVLLRFLFAAALGLTVLQLGGRALAAALLALTAPFLTFFLASITHPSQFAYALAPLGLLAWAGLITTTRARLHLWVLALAGAFWMQLNSGAAKEMVICMAAVHLTGLALAAALPAKEARGERLLVGVVTLVGSVLVGTPLLVTFWDALRDGWTAYDAPRVSQYPTGAVLMFGDNVFHLVHTGRLVPAMHLFAFVFFLAGLAMAVWSPGAPHRVLRPLAVSALSLLAVAYGVVPEGWLLRVPLINNIHHVDVTFSGAAITPACVLAGLGLSQLTTLAPRRALLYLGVTCALLGAVAWAYLRQSTGLPLAFSRGVVVFAGGALVLVTWALRSGSPLSALKLAVVVTALTGLIGRGAVYGTTSKLVDWWVLNLGRRFDMRQQSPVTRAVLEATPEPFRVAGISGVVHAGYRGVLGFEAPDGPDAIDVRAYHELTDALALPFDITWRLSLRPDQFVPHARAMDFFGVSVVFAPDRIDVPGLTLIAEEPRLRAYRRSTAWPRAFFVERLSEVADVRALASRISTADGPFVTVMAAERARRPELAQLLMTTADPPQVIRARDYRLTTNTTSFTVDAPGPGVIYLGETNVEGAVHATVDGVSTPVFTANGAFRAVAVTAAGTHRVEFRYWPRNFTLWLVVSGGGLALIAVLAVWLRRRVPRAPAAGGG